MRVLRTAAVRRAAWLLSARVGVRAGVDHRRREGRVRAPCCRASRSKRPARRSSKRSARPSPTARGQYRIVDLRPGTYTVTFTLTGFSTVKREGIELTGSFTATINADLKVGGVAETITVTGETPIVDVQSVRRQTTLSNEAPDDGADGAVVGGHRRADSRASPFRPAPARTSRSRRR